MAALALLDSSGAARAQEPQRTQEATWAIADFRFRTGETLPQMKVHYFTLGDPKNPAVLVLHGTGGSAAGMLAPGFGGALFGPGQPLDPATHYIIVPDTIGAGDSSKPSDGMHMRFPRYDYADMIEAQHRLLVEHLGVTHLQLVIGNSMGGMLTWAWGEAYPDFMDELVPLASSPTPVTARNWITRRMVVDLIESDPAWQRGDYKSQPPSLAFAVAYFSLITNGGTRAQYTALPTRQSTDDAVTAALKRDGGDANDTIYQFDAARDYDPAPKLETIKARVLAINSEDDERNPAELGVLPREITRVKSGQYFIIPTSDQTHGHGTTFNARAWAARLGAFLAVASPSASSPKGGRH